MTFGKIEIRNANLFRSYLHFIYYKLRHVGFQLFKSLLMRCRIDNCLCVILKMRQFLSFKFVFNYFIHVCLYAGVYIFVQMNAGSQVGEAVRFLQ